MIAKGVCSTHTLVYESLDLYLEPDDKKEVIMGEVGLI